MNVSPTSQSAAPADGSVRLLVRVDHPVKDQVVTLDAKVRPAPARLCPLLKLSLMFD
jgi:hypothetical protein